MKTGINVQRIATGVYKVLEFKAGRQCDFELFETEFSARQYGQRRQDRGINDKFVISRAGQVLGTYKKEG